MESQRTMRERRTCDHCGFKSTSDYVLKEHKRINHNVKNNDSAIANRIDVECKHVQNLVRSVNPYHCFFLCPSINFALVRTFIYIFVGNIFSLSL